MTARPAGAWLLISRLVSLVAAAQSATWASASETPAAAAKVSPLLGQVLDRVAPAGRDAQAGQAGLFKRLADKHQTGTSGTAADTNNKLVPALGYAMEQLDPASFAVLRPIPVGGSGAQLRTGDVFVLQFSTSLPGQVRLENVDSRGRTVDLGTYTVFVDQLNRLPRDKGIQLQGQPGLERLRFYFYPCLPAEAANKTWAADFRGRLPDCQPTAQPLQAAAASGYGRVAPRALVNLAQPDSTLAFAGSDDYKPGEVTLMEAQIRHEGRSHGR